VSQRAQRVAAAAGPKTAPGDFLRMLRVQRQVVDGVNLTVSTNPGVVFGLPMPRWAVAIATFLTIGLVGYFFATSPAGAAGVHTALAMVLAGAIGNLFDRLFSVVALPALAEPIRGQVRDFIDLSEIKVFGLGYPYIFNVADVLLVIGVGMLMVHWWLAARRQARSEKR
jgi:signal peptidase II